MDESLQPTCFLFARPLHISSGCAPATEFPTVQGTLGLCLFKQQEMFSAAVLITLCVPGFLCSLPDKLASHTSSEGGREES